jgi:hypothetical protein
MTRPLPRDLGDLRSRTGLDLDVGFSLSYNRPEPSESVPVAGGPWTLLEHVLTQRNDRQPTVAPT